MSVNTQSNFNLYQFFIADYPPIGVNQVLYVKYTEDIMSATMLMEIQVTDSETGFISELTGMENVFIRIGDSEGATEIGGDFVIYDIQDRRNIGSGLSSYNSKEIEIIYYRNQQGIIFADFTYSYLHVGKLVIGFCFNSKHIHH